MTDCKQCKSYKDCPATTGPTGNGCPDFELGEIRPTGLLKEMFRLQAELNARYGFEKKHAENNDLYAGAWIHDYITAMTSELEELRGCIHWKHWHREAREGRRFMLHDREHAKVEIVDLLFFWMSMAQAAGLTPEDVFDLYKAKLGINHERRDQNMTTEQAHGHELE